jgi:hypothetical protein
MQPPLVWNDRNGETIAHSPRFQARYVITPSPEGFALTCEGEARCEPIAFPSVEDAKLHSRVCECRCVMEAAQERHPVRVRMGRR